MPEGRSLSAWLSWLETLHTTEIDLGLDRVRTVADRLDILDFSARVVTVAGTNGKGSFVKAISQLLLRDELSVGAYTSPHIERYNERISLDGQAVADAQICAAFEQINQAREEISLTYFEFATLAALLIFKQAELDVIVLEVGLGGRLDAVNIVDPDIAVITTIGLDHQEWLGDNREVIGAEKAGILRQGIPFICVENDVPNSIVIAAKDMGCHSYFWGQKIKKREDNTYQLVLQDQPLTLQIANPQLPVPSLLAAAQAYFLLGGARSVDEIGIALAETRLEGRFERIACEDSLFILDVAHNPQASALLVERLRSESLSGLVCVIAAMKDKDIKGIIEPVLSFVDTWVATEIPSLPRSMSAESIAALLGEQGTECSLESDPIKALSLAKKLSKKENKTDGEGQRPILVLGSFYLISEFKTHYLPLVDTA